MGRQHVKHTLLRQQRMRSLQALVCIMQTSAGDDDDDTHIWSILTYHMTRLSRQLMRDAFPTPYHAPPTRGFVVSFGALVGVIFGVAAHIIGSLLHWFRWHGWV
eukprot:TRINITY_DN270_c0_g1_i1.p4 TRINITY_DN270_c0_g1~~TRINITY_DN270_c0_g1_i1.p4  ORF type:complete len:104 (+),score=1.80 TRINITY_DN270_c0_g1_i1:1482-1793(+)